MGWLIWRLCSVDIVILPDRVMKGATVMILIWLTFLLIIIIMFLWTCFKRYRKKEYENPTDLR